MNNQKKYSNKLNKDALMRFCVSVGPYRENTADTNMSDITIIIGI